MDSTAMYNVLNRKCHKGSLVCTVYLFQWHNTLRNVNNTIYFFLERLNEWSIKSFYEMNCTCFLAAFGSRRIEISPFSSFSLLRTVTTRHARTHHAVECTSRRCDVSWRSSASAPVGRRCCSAGEMPRDERGWDVVVGEGESNRWTRVEVTKLYADVHMNACTNWVFTQRLL